MARKQKKYRRLPGNIWSQSFRFRLFDYSRYHLWLATDHLLHVRWMRFSESYKRFDLKDIQAIVASRTSGRRTINLIYGILLAGFATPALMALVWKWPVPIAVLLAPAATIAALMIINTLLGSTCVCRLHTAVQVENLPALGRLRTARKTINILKPLIEAAQGRLTREELGAVSERELVLQASAHALPDASPIRENQKIRHEDGRIHTILFFWLLMGSTAAAVEIFHKSAFKNLIDTLLFLGLIILIILALRKQSNSDLPYGVKTITWVALGFTIANFLFGFFYGTVYRVTHASATVQISSLQSHIQGPVYDGYCIVVAIAELLIAVAGLISLRKFQAEYAASHPTTAGKSIPQRREE